MRHSSLVFAITTSIAAVVMGTAAASAADLAPRVYTKAPAPVVAAYNWSGFYIGGNAGWIGSGSDAVTNTGTDTGFGGLGTVLAAGVIPASLNVSTSGFIGGAQAGYNWQTGNFVFGLEADIDGISNKHSVAAVFPGNGAFVPFTTNYSRESDWLATFRGRVGITAAPSLLLYATGGLAVGETKLGNQLVCATCAPPASTQTGTSAVSDNTSAGWTVGAGAEWMFAQNWSAKVEYLYVDLGNHSSTITYNYGAATSSLTSTVHDTDNIVRAGINYHFGAPVVAKY